MDYNPAFKRVEGVNNMLKMSKLVVMHDTEDMTYPMRPKDLDVNQRFSSWNGRKAMSDCVPVFTKPWEGTFLSAETLICTTVIKGDKDDGLWDDLVRVYKENFDDIDRCFNNYNHDNKDYCTHLRLLIPAALLSTGDILELGSGFNFNIFSSIRKSFR